MKRHLVPCGHFNNPALLLKLKTESPLNYKVVKVFSSVLDYQNLTCEEVVYLCWLKKCFYFLCVVVCLFSDIILQWTGRFKRTRLNN